jgi:hypothetical protein
MWYNLVGGYQHFAATYHLHLQSESGCDTFMRDVGNYQEYHGDSTQKTTIRSVKNLQSSETNQPNFITEILLSKCSSVTHYHVMVAFGGFVVNSLHH